jgi:hypothetical protein
VLNNTNQIYGPNTCACDICSRIFKTASIGASATCSGEFGTGVVQKPPAVPDTASPDCFEFASEVVQVLTCPVNYFAVGGSCILIEGDAK